MSHSTFPRRTLLKQSLAALAASSFSNTTMTKLSGLAAEYDQYDALALAELIAKRKLSPQELLNAVRAKVAALNPKLNAFSHQFFDKAEAQIKQAHGQGVTGAFAGVPFALKDLGQQLAGTTTTAGSRMFKDARYEFDSTLVQRYKQAGLVIFGKTTTPELGLTTTTESALYGKTRNPWNLERIAGGSSGGAAAVVAARIIPAAHASDGGGSIRIPASCCGLFGLKPTRARVPFGPTLFESWAGCSIHHVVSISVRDSAALLDISAGAEPGSPYVAPAPARPFLQEVGAAPGKLRIALVIEPYGGTPLDPECKKAVTDAAKLCEALGHRVTETKLPLNGKEISDRFLTMFWASVARVLEDAANARGAALTEKDVETVTWMIYQAGLKVTARDYVRAVNAFHQFGAQMAKFQEGYDVVLSPTLAKPPVGMNILNLSPANPANYSKDVGEFSPYTALYNMTGQPSMSVPLHWTADGLPVGVMFTARYGDEATLFRLAAQLEQAQPWAQRKPAL
jgi:amidase/6-aminohexanoate-cyclic-dimer hydrolase